ncbi:MAG TPA: nitroreductase family protein [Methylocella sp.]|nr:nitroreductase family protein [Methylocella sp.]
MDIMEAIYTRRTVHEFTAESVDGAAVQAPSAVNRQPWSFVVVQDKALLARISREAKAHLLRTSPAGLVSHHFEDLLSNQDSGIFYHAPALIVISTMTDSPWAVDDGSLAAQNLMLAARAAGSGTWWVGFAKAWLGTPEVKAALNLPAAYVPIAPIIVGHPKSAPPPVPSHAGQ